MGLTRLDAAVDADALKRPHRRHRGAPEPVDDRTCSLSQGVRVVPGTGSLKGPHEVVVETAGGLEELEADAVLLSTGSRPRIPEWASPTATGC